MRLLRTDRFKKDFKKLPAPIQERTLKSLRLFVNDSRHPSLHTKKMEGVPGVWEMRVSDDYRITFQYAEEGVLLRRVGPHDILRIP